MNIDGALVSRFPGRLRTLTLLGAVVAALALSGGFTPANAQSRDLTGVVRDSLNSESLPNAFVYLVGQPFRTLTDEFGRFTLVDVPEGVHTLRVEYLGYLMGEVEVAVATAGALTVYLAPAVIELEGITVESSGQIAQVAEEISQITLSPRRLNTLPSLGETDIFRALQLLPGVSGTNDATSGLFIRGGTPDENLVLLDGMTVYHVDHFFGVFSAFNSDAIKDIRLFKGGFPAQYGGRTSSVVEMIGKSGDPENFNMSAGMNLLSGRAVTEVPLGGKGSWLLFRASVLHGCDPDRSLQRHLQHTGWKRGRRPRPGRSGRWLRGERWAGRQLPAADDSAGLLLLRPQLKADVHADGQRRSRAQCVRR